MIIRKYKIHTCLIKYLISHIVMKNWLSCKKHKYESRFVVILNTVIKISQANHTLQGHFCPSSPAHIQRYFGNGPSSNFHSLSFFSPHSYTNVVISMTIKKNFDRYSVLISVDCFHMIVIVITLFFNILLSSIHIDEKLSRKYKRQRLFNSL